MNILSHSFSTLRKIAEFSYSLTFWSLLISLELGPFNAFLNGKLDKHRERQMHQWRWRIVVSEVNGFESRWVRLSFLHLSINRFTPVVFAPRSQGGCANRFAICRVGTIVAMWDISFTRLILATGRRHERFSLTLASRRVVVSSSLSSLSSSPSSSSLRYHHHYIWYSCKINNIIVNLYKDIWIYVKTEHHRRFYFMIEAHDWCYASCLRLMAVSPSVYMSDAEVLIISCDCVLANLSRSVHSWFFIPGYMS